MFSKSICADNNVPQLKLDKSNALQPMAPSSDDSDLARKRKNFRGGTFGLRRLSPSPSMDVAAYAAPASPTIENKIIPLRFEQLDDQRLRIMYVPLLIGSYTIDILLRGEHPIIGSPFTSKVTVVPQRASSSTSLSHSTPNDSLAIDPLHNSAAADLENLRAIKSNYIAQHIEMKQKMSEEKGSAPWNAQLPPGNAKRRSSVAMDPGTGLVQRRVVRKMISSGSLSTPVNKFDFVDQPKMPLAEQTSDKADKDKAKPAEDGSGMTSEEEKEKEKEKKTSKGISTLVTAPTLQDFKLETVMEADERSERSSRSSKHMSLRRSFSETSDRSISRQKNSLTESRSTLGDMLSVAQPSEDRDSTVLENADVTQKRAKRSSLDARSLSPDVTAGGFLSIKRSNSEQIASTSETPQKTEKTVEKLHKQQQVSYEEIKAETGWKRPSAFALAVRRPGREVARIRQPIVCVISPSVAQQNSISHSDDTPFATRSIRIRRRADDREQQPDGDNLIVRKSGVSDSDSQNLQFEPLQLSAALGYIVAANSNPTTTTATTITTNTSSDTHSIRQYSKQSNRKAELHASSSTNLSSTNHSSNPSGDEARESNNNGGSGNALQRSSSSPPCVGSPFYLTGSDVYFGGMGVENRFYIHVPLPCNKDLHIDASESENDPKVEIEGQANNSVVYVHVDAESPTLNNELCYRVRYKVQDRGFYRILISHMDEQRCYVCKVLH